MFSLIALLVSVSGSEMDSDRLPEVDLSFSVKKVEIVRDSVVKVSAPKQITFADFLKLKDNRKLETPSKDWDPIPFN